MRWFQDSTLFRQLILQTSGAGKCAFKTCFHKQRQKGGVQFNTCTCASSTSVRSNMMRVLMVVVATLRVVRGYELPFTEDLAFSCREANKMIDKALMNSNFYMESKGLGNMLIDITGFDTEVDVYAFGWRLPVTVSLSVSNANMTGINTLKRATDATDCSTPISRILDGVFEYGPNLAVKYEDTKAKFLFWELQGKLIFKPKPRMHIALFNSTYNCRFESIGKENPGQSEYVFETDGNSWMGWLISKLVVRGLEQKDDITMTMQVDIWSQETIISYFTKAWCALDFDSSDHA